MSRKFITTIIAGAIAVTGFTTSQAQAGDRDLMRFLAGATALVIIGKAISDDNDRRHQPQIVTRNHSHGHGAVQGRSYYTHRHQPHGNLHRHPVRNHARKEARKEIRREVRREARREVRREYRQVQPRPLPERVRRHGHGHVHR